MAHDGCQTPSWYGQAFSYLPKTHRAEPHQAPPSAASAFAAAVATSGGYRQSPQGASTSGAPQGYSAEDVLRMARTGTWDGPAPRGRGEKAAPIEPVKPAPASKTETSVSLGAGRKRLPLCGLEFLGGGGGQETKLSSSLLSLPLNVVVDVHDASSVAAAAEALRGLSDQQREEEVFLTLVLDALSVERAAANSAVDGALGKLGRGTADLVLLDWSKIVDLERGQPLELRSAGREAWTAAATELLGSGSATGGRRRARALGLANAGLADVEGLLALAEETSKEAASPAPRPAALAVELHPLLPQRKLVGVCRRKGVAMIALNPAGNGSGAEGAGCPNTRALLESAAVAAAAAAEGKSPREVLLRWSAERGIPFAAASSSSLSAELAAVPCWALSPASRDALDGAVAVATAELRTLVPKAGAGFVFPGASEGGAGKASEVMLQ